MEKYTKSTKKVHYQFSRSNQKFTTSTTHNRVTQQLIIGRGHHRRDIPIFSYTHTRPHL